MNWTIYLSGEIHTDWRAQIMQGTERNKLPVVFTSAVTAQYGVGNATTKASISGCTLHKMTATQDSGKVWGRLSPVDQLPRSNGFGQGSGENTL